MRHTRFQSAMSCDTGSNAALDVPLLMEEPALSVMIALSRPTERQRAGLVSTQQGGLSVEEMLTPTSEWGAQAGRRLGHEILPEPFLGCRLRDPLHVHEEPHPVVLCHIVRGERMRPFIRGREVGREAV